MQRSMPILNAGSSVQMLRLAGVVAVAVIGLSLATPVAADENSESNSTSEIAACFESDNVFDIQFEEILLDLPSFIPHEWSDPDSHLAFSIDSSSSEDLNPYEISVAPSDFRFINQLYFLGRQQLYAAGNGVGSIDPVTGEAELILPVLMIARNPLGTSALIELHFSISPEGDTGVDLTPLASDWGAVTLSASTTIGAEPQGDYDDEVVSDILLQERIAHVATSYFKAPLRWIQMFEAIDYSGFGFPASPEELLANEEFTSWATEFVESGYYQQAFGAFNLSPIEDPRIVGNGFVGLGFGTVVKGHTVAADCIDELPLDENPEEEEDDPSDDECEDDPDGNDDTSQPDDVTGEESDDRDQEEENEDEESELVCNGVEPFGIPEEFPGDFYIDFIHSYVNSIMNIHSVTENPVSRIDFHVHDPLPDDPQRYALTVDPAGFQFLDRFFLMNEEAHHVMTAANTGEGWIDSVTGEWELTIPVLLLVQHRYANGSALFEMTFSSNESDGGSPMILDEADPAWGTIVLVSTNAIPLTPTGHWDDTLVDDALFHARLAHIARVAAEDPEALHSALPVGVHDPFLSNLAELGSTSTELLKGETFVEWATSFIDLGYYHELAWAFQDPREMNKNTTPQIGWKMVITGCDPVYVDPRPAVSPEEAMSILEDEVSDDPRAKPTSNESPTTDEAEPTPSETTNAGIGDWLRPFANSASNPPPEEETEHAQIAPAKRVFQTYSPSHNETQRPTSYSNSYFESRSPEASRTPRQYRTDRLPEVQRQAQATNTPPPSLDPDSTETVRTSSAQPKQQRSLAKPSPASWFDRLITAFAQIFNDFGNWLLSIDLFEPIRFAFLPQDLSNSPGAMKESSG